MKKLSKWLLLSIATAIAVCAFALAACGDGNKAETADYAGTYKFGKVEVIGSKTYSVGDTFEGTVLTADYFVMIFGEDGSFTVNSPLEERNAATSPYVNQIHGNMTGTWQLDADSGVKVTIEGMDIRLLSSDGKEVTYEFTFGLNSYKYYFQKV